MNLSFQCAYVCLYMSLLRTSSTHVCQYCPLFFVGGLVMRSINFPINFHMISLFFTSMRGCRCHHFFCVPFQRKSVSIHSSVSAAREWRSRTKLSWWRRQQPFDERQTDTRYIHTHSDRKLLLESSVVLKHRNSNCDNELARKSEITAKSRYDN